jgi:hypothetical protein
MDFKFCVADPLHHFTDRNVSFNYARAKSERDASMSGFFDKSGSIGGYRLRKRLRKIDHTQAPVSLLRRYLRHCLS